MKSILMLSFSALLIVGLVGCSEVETGDTPDAPGDAKAPAAPAAADKEMTVEIACAGCIFKMEGAKGCQAAVKVAGTPMMLIGETVDAHAIGLCKASKQAAVVGHVENNQFVASKVTLQ